MFKVSALIFGVIQDASLGQPDGSGKNKNEGDPSNDKIALLS